MPVLGTKETRPATAIFDVSRRVAGRRLATSTRGRRHDCRGTGVRVPGGPWQSDCGSLGGRIGRCRQRDFAFDRVPYSGCGRAGSGNYGWHRTLVAAGSQFEFIRFALTGSSGRRRRHRACVPWARRSLGRLPIVRTPRNHHSAKSAAAPSVRPPPAPLPLSGYPRSRQRRYQRTIPCRDDFS
jgi:hypothetical protein